MSELRVPVVLVIDTEPIRRGWDDHVASCAEEGDEPEPYDVWEREWVDGIVDDAVGHSTDVSVERVEVEA